MSRILECCHCHQMVGVLYQDEEGIIQIKPFRIMSSEITTIVKAFDCNFNHTTTITGHFTCRCGQYNFFESTEVIKIHRRNPE